MIVLKAVSKIYQMGNVQVKALDNVSLKIRPGEFVAIIGSSGSGKSTLLHILGGLDRPTEGKVIWENKDLSQMSDEELALFRNQTMGFIFQQFQLLPRLTVIENILLPTLYSSPSLKQGAFQRAKKLLSLVGLSHRLNHTPNQLSGGEQQRVAIARALINNPRAILADEPTGNLDSKTGRQIMAILEKLNRDQGITLIVVTHDPSIAKEARRVIEIKDGKVKNSKS